MHPPYKQKQRFFATREDRQLARCESSEAETNRQLARGLGKCQANLCLTRPPKLRLRVLHRKLRATFERESLPPPDYGHHRSPFVCPSTENAPAIQPSPIPE